MEAGWGFVALLIRPGAIGDFIVSLPAMEALRGGLYRGLVRRAERGAGAVCGSGAVDRVGRAGPAGAAARGGCGGATAGIRFDCELVRGRA